MNETRRVYMGTVCLERNRWGSREPSFPVSEWLPRFEADGFDGVELWENHFLAVDAAEQARLMGAGSAIAIYNSYAGFADEDAEGREKAAGAIALLKPAAVKYNVGGDARKPEEYRRNLLAWADQLPSDCRLLCECHPGTVLERLRDAVAFFADLDPERFGVIVHLNGDSDGPECWFKAFGKRIQHVHVQLRGPENDPTVTVNRRRLDVGFAIPGAHGFEGSVALEFTRGIGRDEEIGTLYANACTDLAYCREML